jgi:ankyrin repeat protein
LSPRCSGSYQCFSDYRDDSQNGRTALHRAAKAHLDDLVLTLLEHGADSSAVDLVHFYTVHDNSTAKHDRFSMLLDLFMI